MKAPRVLDKASAIHEGDLISTAETSFALIDFNDGMQVTVRENSVLEIERFSQAEGNETAVLNLTRGGIRVISGAIAREKPEALEVNTPIAPVKVMGTEFDVRLCESDCADEEQNAQVSGEQVVQSEVIGRVVTITGSIAAVDGAGVERALAVGGPVYAGDTIRSAAQAFGVIAFTDRGVMTVLPNTEFAIENYRYEEGGQAENGFVSNLVTGGLRTLTGAVANRNPDNFAITTPTASLGVRGTGFDVGYQNPILVFVWQGSVIYVGEDGIPIEIPEGATLCGPGPSAAISDDCFELYPELAEAFEGLPRPDEVEIDFEELFGAQSHDGMPPGLYVMVYDGHVRVFGVRVLDLGAGESLYATEEVIYRLELAPIVLYLDAFPRPDTDLSALILIEFTGILTDSIVTSSTGLQCVIR